MMSRKAASRRNSRQRTVIAALVAVAIPIAARSEPCNPIIDGTYCATQMPTGRAAELSARSMNPIRSIGGDFNFGSSQDSPGTLGSISFRGGGSRCVGSMIRSRCS
ncbi:MAG TPA: hypothetical protein VGC86_00535 [Afipia sp.]